MPTSRLIALLLSGALLALGSGLGSGLGCGQGDGGDRGADDEAARAEDGRLRVYVVNHPLEYFARRIGGDAVAVTFPAPPGLDPAF